MNILLYDKKHLVNGLVHIENLEKIQHIRTILKLKIGDELRIGEINGLLGTATIHSISERLITLAPTLSSKPPQALPCTLVLALPRPQQLKRILLHLSSLGVKDIHLIQSARVEKNYWQSPTLKQIDDYLLEGLEQAQDTLMPSVCLHKSLKNFIEKEFPKISQEKKMWLTHPGNFSYCSRQSVGEHLILIGPEGGFVPEEVELFIQLGCEGISLGSRILKVETALPILLGSMFQLP